MKAVILIVLLLLTGCATHTASPVFTESAFARIPPKPYAISLGDSFSVTMDLNPRGQSPVTVRVTVDREGCVELPIIGKVRVIGMTYEEAQDALEQAAYDHGYRPGVPQWKPRYYAVTSEVNKPGYVEFLGTTTLIKAIVAAGGFTKRANRKRLSIRRANGMVVEHYNYNDLLKEHRDAPLVYPGDLVHVERKKTLW